MDPGELGYDGECIIDGKSDDPSYMHGMFGNPQMLPRVGEQYQVKIPPLVTDSEHLQLMKNPADTDVTVELSFLMGLPIPIMWIHEQLDKIKHKQRTLLGDQGGNVKIEVKVESERTKEVHINLDNADAKVKVEYLDVGFNNRKGPGGLENGEAAAVMDIDLPLFQYDEPSHHIYSSKDYSPFPGSVGKSWSNTEVKSFLLGLYIFGKNLKLVRKFVETKEMGDILSYYYGSFYQSADYRRWSECRKIRSRKCIHGQKIFTGERQRELLSRLLPSLASECGNTLMEVSKTFSEGEILLEDYVFTLKAKVGMNALIEAIGIGKGKQDLTGIVDSVKSSRPEIPIGSECNSLSPSDIIKFLTGDFRLSKKRSNDLFWDAVWPRLLENGWHSEEPRRSRGNVGNSKHPLVFIIPGVKKFSKRKLMKGNHYFDSVTDVLNKVASDPRLLVLKGESIPHCEGIKEENGFDTDLKVDGPPDVRCQIYLQPRNPICGESDDLKFTVVDTSLQSKVRELRSLPPDTTIISPPTSVSRESDTESSEEDQEAVDMVLSNGQDHLERRSSNEMTEDQENQKHHVSKNKPVKRRAKPSQSKYLTPITKRRRLTACGNAETSSVPPEEEEDLHLDSPGSSDNINKIVHETPNQRRPLIDLNLPHISVDSDTDEPVAGTELLVEETKMAEDSGTLTVEEPPAGRRQSTRNRPLTTKALEALECGYLNTKQRKPRGEEGSRPSRRRRVRAKAKFGGSSIPDREADDYSSNYMNVISNSGEDWIERKVEVNDELLLHPDYLQLLGTKDD
ncbi:hypothetical protein ACHQM5_026546 [Ranunculus cassubicifolius]